MFSDQSRRQAGDRGVAGWLAEQGSVLFMGRRFLLRTLQLERSGVFGSFGGVKVVK